MKHAENSYQSTMKHQRHKKFLLFIGFIWLAMVQVSSLHASQHGLQADNNCAVCLFQVNLNATTFNSITVFQLEIESVFTFHRVPTSLFESINFNFSARDPPKKLH